MANTSSAKKAIRVSARRSIINIRKRRDYKEARKEVIKTVTAKDKKQATELMKDAQKTIDKAVKLNVIHKNTASRYKSRLAKMVKSL